MLFGAAPYDMVDGVVLSPAHCRAGRGLLRWSQIELARHAGTAVVTVRRFETGVEIGAKPTEALRRALTAAGVIFVPGGELDGERFEVAVALASGVLP